MNIVRPQAASRRWIGTAIAIMLFTCSAAVHAGQRDTAKKRSESAPAGNAARPAPQTPPATIPGSGRTARPNRQDSGQNPQPAPTRPNHPDPAQTAQPSPNRPNRPDPAQNAQPSQNRPNRPDPAQSAQPSPNRPYNRPDANQGSQQPGRDQGRPGYSNPGQNGHQNPDQPPDSRGHGPSPQVTRTSNGGMVHRDSNGEVRQVHTPGGAVITHRSDGFRHIEVQRPGNLIVVTNSRGFGGYVQRPLIVSNHQYFQRTYSVHGMTTVRVFRPVTYLGVSLHVYTPMRYYRPSFYTYVYNAWARPIVYDWSWGGRPWYGYYQGYFAPYPAYGSPTLWLTDYMIGSVLERAYEERAEGAGWVYSGQGGMTPEVKQAIADEVRLQLDLERSESQSQNAAYGDVPPMFADHVRHVFVVSNSLEVASSRGVCMITAGDVLQLAGGPPADPNAADVVVLASKGRDCHRGSIASVPIHELQEMQNDMRAALDQGLADFQSRHGQSGLPILPPSAASPVVNASFASSVTPDANVAGELTSVAQEADRAEQAVVNDANAPAGSSGPATITLGQTIEAVASILGQPQKVVDLGMKKIYVYKDMKITFTDGRVSDVQ